MRIQELKHLRAREILIIAYKSPSGHGVGGWMYMKSSPLETNSSPALSDFVDLKYVPHVQNFLILHSSHFS